MKRKNGDPQLSLFQSADENPPLREAIEFYKHKHNWSNRLIAGDSLLVMNSLLEKEGMAAKMQMVYIDPPYGISSGSNFQPFVNKRDVKDGKDEDLTAEPEMVKAFRDAWELKAEGVSPLPVGAKVFRYNPLFSAKSGPNEPVEIEGKSYPSGGNS